jgi:hypothetical protein
LPKKEIRFSDERRDIYLFQKKGGRKRKESFRGVGSLVGDIGRENRENEAIEFTENIIF